MERSSKSLPRKLRGNVGGEERYFIVVSRVLRSKPEPPIQTLNAHVSGVRKRLYQRLINDTKRVVVLNAPENIVRVKLIPRKLHRLFPFFTKKEMRGGEPLIWRIDHVKCVVQHSLFRSGKRNRCAVERVITFGDRPILEKYSSVE